VCVCEIEREILYVRERDKEERECVRVCVLQVRLGLRSGCLQTDLS